jgi:putative Holliday junction resolvase
VGNGASGAVLGFDYGRRRIGVAVGQTITRSATPVTTLEAVAGGPDWPRLLALVAEWRPSGLVVGVPYNADRTPHDLTHEVLAFASTLGERTGLPVHTVDERLSSAEASATLREQRAAGRKRVVKSDVDAAAACVILNGWLGAQP